MNPMSDWQIFVSANDGHVIHVQNIAMAVDVNAKIFNPNPITTTQTIYGSTSNYKDNNNATNYVSGHDGGQIWSTALMKIWGDLGRDITDKLFLETHLIWGQFPTLRDAATAFMKADLNLYNGSHLCQIYSRFQEHGLINTNQIVNTTSFVNQTVTTSKIVFSCTDLNVQSVTVQNGAKLTLDAAGEVNIIRDFEVQSGSEFEIK